MPSIAEEIEAARRHGYLLGLHYAHLRCLDDDGYYRSASVIRREIEHEMARVQETGILPGK